ncbi:Dolichyl-phosphate-mannose-protein mannosyltransferase, putative [Trichomonas vaginalis G3]|uniref:Dolichyl-phosphate-mannose-protein mannosyltransferase, putative n=1 Tax=Trichomonas vaginalis (strain ATCC PRA-98 / G3) TaxID=412133 RepID=A2G1N9_TRIV3|nr:dolichyl-phosphate-mannose-protein mannosyltransferase protein [Trichomonas vaginalis G3]EAX88925.1 Dolichyl-phosphate-mannose-protein mannosyltransferase, putative [Trichomonas vaginalis G3]KAI5512494.1 dolichyl-phosphate-mannose-protein mannosyltransferase protein [Trichomonas vaginalis G3]|eukprot:XP_001301855.1 Dolichyl-phosphate-mannose-protein mannosyltransferase [Trichomonas vaginalis G3]
MATVAYFADYDANLTFENCPDSGYHEGDYIQLRLTPALFSSLVMPFVYLSMRFMNFSKLAAIAASVLYMCDTSLITEARHILSDGVLLFFSYLHVLILSYTISIPVSDLSFFKWHIINGISLGAACSCKNTAWGLMGFDGAMYICKLFPSYKIGLLDYLFDIGFYGVTLFLIQFCVYLSSFFIHFAVLVYDGPGKGYLPQDMQEQLVIGGVYGLKSVLISGRNLLKRTLWLAKDMHKGNMGITQFHDSMSYPHHWPILGSVAVYFYGMDQREIRCLGNVFSYYFALFGIVCCLFAFRKEKKLISLLLAFGYSCCYFPFYLIPRVMYLYHYLIPLGIACMGFGAFVDNFCKGKWKGIVVVVVCILAIIGFWLWSPYIYATPMRDKEISIWNENWIEGDQAHRRRRSEHYAKKK